MNAKDTALVVLNLQSGLINMGLRLYKTLSKSTIDNMVANNKTLVHHFLANKRPVFIVTMEPRLFTRGMNAKFADPILKPAADANLHVLVKHSADALKDTDLHAQLQKLGVQRLILTGYATNNSVYKTAMTAEHDGYQVTVVSDASAAKSIDLHMDTIDKLTTVINTASLIK
jgi:nicotinamidase-related amidase